MVFFLRRLVSVVIRIVLKFVDICEVIMVFGIFWLSGFEKCIKDFKMIFDFFDWYGKGFDWEGYNVYDVVNVLCRYFNDLLEFVVSLDFYGKFCEFFWGVMK